jgi:segregation and condensation protein B
MPLRDSLSRYASNMGALPTSQPISHDGLKEIFGREVSRDLIGRLAMHNLIGTVPREPRRGAPYTFVATDAFLAAFGMETLRDLPDPEQLMDAGLAVPSEAPDV